MLEEQKGHILPDLKYLIDPNLNLDGITEAVLIDPDVVRYELPTSFAPNETAERRDLSRTVDFWKPRIINRPVHLHRLGLKLHLSKRHIRPMRPEVVVAKITAADARSERRVDFI